MTKKAMKQKHHEVRQVAVYAELGYTLFSVWSDVNTASVLFIPIGETIGDWIDVPIEDLSYSPALFGRE